jgi:hypothetical protein
VDPEAGAIEGERNGGIDEAAQNPADAGAERAALGLLGDRRSVFRERLEDRVHRCMVPRHLAHVAVGELAPGPNHEDAAQLPDVPLDTSLARSAAQGTQGVE